MIVTYPKLQELFYWEVPELIKASFLTVIENGSESFGAFAPDIQGCIAFSKSRAEVSHLFKLAAEAHFRELANEGQPLPKPNMEGIPGIEIGVQTGAITLEWTTIELPLAA